MILPFVVNGTTLRMLVLRIRSHVCLHRVFARCVRTHDSPSARIGWRGLLREGNNRLSDRHCAGLVSMYVSKKKKRVSAIHDGGVSPPRLRPTRDSFLVGGDGNVEGGTADDCAWAADGRL